MDEKKLDSFLKWAGLRDDRMPEAIKQEFEYLLIRMQNAYKLYKMRHFSEQLTNRKTQEFEHCASEVHHFAKSHKFEIPDWAQESYQEYLQHKKTIMQIFHPRAKQSSEEKQ